MSGLWLLSPQQSFSWPLLASGYKAHEVAVVGEMHLMRFLKKHWLSSGDLRFSPTGKISGEVSGTDMGILLLVLLSGSSAF